MAKQVGATVEQAADPRVAQRIREAREAKGLPQGQLAYRIGTSREQVDRYERGIDRVGVQDLVAIAQVVGVPVAAFFGDHDGEESEMSEGHERISDELANRLIGARRGAEPRAPEPRAPEMRAHERPAELRAPEVLPPPRKEAVAEPRQPELGVPEMPPAAPPQSRPHHLQREALVLEAVRAFTRIEEPTLRRALAELLRQLC